MYLSQTYAGKLYMPTVRLTGKLTEQPVQLETPRFFNTSQTLLSSIASGAAEVMLFQPVFLR